MHVFSFLLKITIVALLFILTGCSSSPELKPGEGYMETTGGKVWYRVKGEGDKTPLLLLHGGPGFTSYYLNPMAELAEDRPVVFYDQLGCGRSDREIDTTLMSIESYVEQVEQLRTHLGLDEFYLYGHSWGTRLALEYYLKYSGQVKGLIFASPALSISRWTQDADQLIATLPDSIQSAIRINVENNSFDSPEYEHAISVYYQNFVARKLPWDANMDSTFTHANLSVYNYMWGPSEFTATGTLLDYERTDQLIKIRVPTLYICGEYDESRPETVKYFQSLTPGAELSIIKEAAHITMHDNVDENNEAISAFLTELDP